MLHYTYNLGEIMDAPQKYGTRSKKSIARPFIRRDSFQLHQRILDNFIHIENKKIDAHNAVNPSEKRQKLTEAHRSLLQALYFEAVSQYEMRLELFSNTELAPLPFKLGDPVCVNTNNKDLAYRLSRSNPRVASTIYRRLNRIRECGGITGKINHGTQANYDLYINPDLFLLWDAEDENYHPSSKFLNGNNSESYLPQRAKCKPSKDSISFGKNKKTIAVDSSVPVNKSAEPNETAAQGKMRDLHDAGKTEGRKTPRAGECASTEESAEEKTEERPEGKDTQAGGARRGGVDLGVENAQKRAFVAAKFLYKYAVWMLWSADAEADNTGLAPHLRTRYGGKLWNGKAIHLPEEQQAIRYLAAHYFANDTSPIGLERQIQNMQNRIRMASEYLGRQDYYKNGQWFVTPTQFFDQNNRNGFIGTYKWLSMAKEWKERKTKLADSRKRMLKHLERYLSEPSFENYNRQLNSVRRAVPQLEAEFIQRATATSLGKTAGKNKSNDGFQELLSQVRECRLSHQPFIITNP